MEITESGITTEVSPVPLKVLTPIDVTVLVMVTEVIVLISMTSASPTEITESGITTEVNSVLEKAPSPMEL